jgi:superfamily II DNA or RNA helicase
MSTPHHAKYFAHDLTRRATSGMDRLSMALFDAAVDLNPHQIEAALFSLQSPLSKGVILADEVGLGKTIEAGIVLCQLWAERKRRLLVICPASIRKQWALELEEKFNLPVQVLDAKAYREARRSGQVPLAAKAIVVMSHHFTNSMREEVKAVAIDEAHKLRNAYRPSSREVNVDLLETFNWLIGLTVQHIAAPQRFSAEFARDSEKRLRLKGRLRQDAADAKKASPRWFRTVTGTTPDARKTLIIWRKLTGEPEQDNLVLDEWFTRQGYSTKDYEFQLIYVNGSNNLEKLKAEGDTWKVRLIEEDSHRLMFEPEGV